LDEEAITEIRKAANQGLVLGGERFREEIERVLGRRVGLQKAGRKKDVRVSDPAGEQRGFEF